VVADVGHQEGAPTIDERHPLWLVEGRRREVASFEATRSGAGNIDDLAGVQVGNDDAMVIGVGNEQTAPGGVGENLARERQHGFGRPLDIEVDRGTVY